MLLELSKQPLERDGPTVGVKVERLFGLRLDDPETLTSLQVAFIARETTT
jgi:hypothetical protein